MNVFAIQLNIVWHDKQANHEKVRRLLEREHIPAGSMIVLPEMFATGFSMDVPAIADEVTRETENFVRGLAREKNSTVVAGVVTRRDGRGLNEALVAFPDDRSPFRYQKIHPFTLGGESDNFHAGKDVSMFDWHEFKVAPFVCYDLRFPEIFRRAAFRGANMMLAIASWPIVREEHWITLLRARAIENQCYVVGVNRSGKDPTLTYNGRSQIIGPKGGIIADAGNNEGVISAPVSYEAMMEYRRDLPFLKDLRPRFIGEA